MSVCTHTVPCVVFAFNRPDKLQRILSALKSQDIERLILFVDGPRDERDVDPVEECKRIAEAVNWVDKELHFRDQNRGLPGLGDNIGTVLKAYRWGVFVEDDCLPMPGFYAFVRRALSHYESEKKVFSIGGYQPIRRKYFQNYPYSLVSSARFMCWGWATWQDRWELITPYLSRYSELFDGLRNVPNVAGRDLATMARACAQGTLRTWAVQVAISTLWLEQVHLLPTRGLVRNIGMDVSGTHRFPKSHMYDRNVTEEPAEDMAWLQNVELNTGYAKRLARFVDETAGRTLWSRVKRKVRRNAPSFVRRWYRLVRQSLGSPG